MYITLRVIRALFGLVALWQLYRLFSVLVSSEATYGQVTTMAWAIAIVDGVIVIVFGALFFASRLLINRIHRKRTGSPHPALVSHWSI